MDEYETQKLQTLSNYIKSKLLKKVTHVVLSVSLFSFFFPHSLPWLSFFHSFSYCFSTFPIQLITHTVDKNCIFFLCNGILVLVVKNSGLISPSKSDEDNNNTSQMKPVYLDMKEQLRSSQTIVEVMDNANEEETIMEEKTINVVEESKDDHEENEVLISGLNEEEEEQEDGGCYVENVVEDKEEEEEEEKEDEVVVVVDEDEEEKEEEEREDDEYNDDNDDDYDESVGEEDARLSTDELNKKFDEFIRRMKEDLRFEARQHLVMV